MLPRREDHTVNQKYDGYIQPANQDVFEVLNSRLVRFMPDWTSKRVLDFGCNVGHLLKTAGDKLPHSNFVGVDIHKESIEIARGLMPNATWVHFNGYNPTFNPGGERDALPELDGKFDVIVVYGVFTHCCLTEIHKWLAYLRSILSPGGVIIFSIWENTSFAGYVRFLKTQFGVSVRLVPYGYNKYMYLLNRQELLFDSPDLPEEKYDWIETFYKRSFMLEEFPDAKVVGGLPSLHATYVIS